MDNQNDGANRRATVSMRRGLIGASALAAATAIGTMVVIAFRGADPPEVMSADGARAFIAREIPICRGAAALVVGKGSVWVAEPNAVARIDPTSGGLLGLTEIEGVSRRSTFTVGNGSVWVTAGSPRYAGRTPDLVRIDPHTGAVSDRVTISSELNAIVSIGKYIVYGAAGEGIGFIGLYEPDMADFRNSIGAGGDGPPSAIIDSDAGLWVAGNRRAGGLDRVVSDFSNIKAVRGIGRVGSMAVAGGYLWVQGDELSQVDLSSGEVVASRAVAELSAVASDGSHLWILTGTDSSPSAAIRLDPMTGEPLDAPIELGHSTPARLAVGTGGA